VDMFDFVKLVLTLRASFAPAAGHLPAAEGTGGGRELGQEGLDEFYEVKHVHWDVEGKLKDYWYPYGK